MIARSRRDMPTTEPESTTLIDLDLGLSQRSEMRFERPLCERAAGPRPPIVWPRRLPAPDSPAKARLRGAGFRASGASLVQRRADVSLARHELGARPRFRQLGEAPN